MWVRLLGEAPSGNFEMSRLGERSRVGREMQIDPQFGSDLVRAYAHSPFQGGIFSGIDRAMVHFRAIVEADLVFPPVPVHRLNRESFHPAFSDRFNPNEKLNTEW